MKSSSCGFCSTRRAYPPCGLSFYLHSNDHGEASACSGDHGFGYDPIFIPEGHSQTFGEMDPALKDSLSHRTRAFAMLKAALID